MHEKIEIYIIYLLELSAALIATITYKNYWKTPSRIFLFYLWFTILIELLANITFLKDNSWLFQVLKNIFNSDITESNIWLFNIHSIITYNTYLYYLLHLIKSIRSQKVVQVFIIVFNAISIYSAIDIGHFNDGFYTLIEGFGSIFLFISSILYFNDVFKSNEILIFYKKLPFWIVTGGLLFYLTITPMFILPNQIRIQSDHFKYILLFANTILYLFFIIGFTIHAWKEKNIYSHNS